MFYKIFKYDYQKYKNQKPDRKLGPDKLKNFKGWISMLIQIHLHWFFWIWPLEVHKPETGQKTGPRTNWKFL